MDVPVKAKHARQRMSVERQKRTSYRNAAITLFQLLRAVHNSGRPCCAEISLLIVRLEAVSRARCGFRMTDRINTTVNRTRLTTFFTAGLKLRRGFSSRQVIYDTTVPALAVRLTETGLRRP